MSGDIQISGNAGSVNSTSGDIECGSVSGSVSTVSGDVNVNGNVEGKWL